MQRITSRWVVLGLLGHASFQPVWADPPREPSYFQRLGQDCTTALIAVTVALIVRPYFVFHETPSVLPPNSQVAAVTPNALDGRTARLIGTRRLIAGKIYFVQNEAGGHFERSVATHESVVLDGIPIQRWDRARGDELFFTGDAAKIEYELLTFDNEYLWRPVHYITVD